MTCHRYNYVRGKTWIAPPFVSDQMCQIFGLKPTTENRKLSFFASSLQDLNYLLDVYSEEEKAALADPEFFKVFRRRLEHHMNVRFSQAQVDRETNQMIFLLYRM